MSDEFDPLNYKPTQIEVDKILPMELSDEAIDKLLDKIDEEIQKSGTVKEILEALGVAGKFAVKLGAEVAAQSLADGALDELGDLGGLSDLLGG